MLLDGWYTSYFREWYDTLGIDTYSFELECCCVPAYWLLESTVSGELKPRPPEVTSEPPRLSLVPGTPAPQPAEELEGPFLVASDRPDHTSKHYIGVFGRGWSTSYSLRVWLKYGRGNEVDEWWHYGARYLMLWKGLVDLGVSLPVTLAFLMGQSYDVVNVLAASRVVGWKIALTYAFVRGA